jgi:hypothetical protein
VPSRQPDNQIAMKHRRSARRRDEATIGKAREGRDTAFDLTTLA